MRDLALALLLVGAGSGLASAQSVDEFRSERSLVERLLVSTVDAFEQARAEFDVLTDEIEALKSAGAASPLEVLQLQQRMQTALSFSDTLEELQARRDAAIEELAALDAMHIAAVEAQLERLLQQRPWTEVLAATAAELQAYLDERSVAIQSASVPVLDLRTIRASLRWSPEEMRAAADELADYQDAMQQQLQELEHAARQAQRREELEQRARTMRRQESLFDDSFSRRAPQSQTQAAAGGQGGQERSSVDGAGQQTEPTASRVAGDDMVTAGESPPVSSPAADSDFGTTAEQAGAPEAGFEPSSFGPIQALDVPNVVEAQVPGAPTSGVVDPTLFGVDRASESSDDGRGRRAQSAAALRRQADELRQRVREAQAQERALRESAEETHRSVD